MTPDQLAAKVAVLWQPPFDWDITEFVQSGKEHSLEIAVGISWLNRLIGDEQYPDDLVDDSEWKAGRWPKWFIEGGERPEPRRKAFASLRELVKADTPLAASGLQGPVCLRIIQDLPVPEPSGRPERSTRSNRAKR
jgi:hypothetical protein